MAPEGQFAESLPSSSEASFDSSTFGHIVCQRTADIVCARHYIGSLRALVLTGSMARDEATWTLDPDSRAEAPAHQHRQQTADARLLECSRCSALRMGGQPWPSCGFMPQRPAQVIFAATPRR